jgi:DNA-binding CsgD family transcriptional regulator
MKGELALWLWRADGFGEHTTIPSDIALPFAFEVAGDWQRAADAWKALGCPYEHANALASSGFEQQQFEALAILEQLGATAAASALRKRMRAQGVREAQIPELLSEGLRNAAIAMRLFIATKTVDHHVSAILMKLGVSSRADAVAMARKKANDDS